MKLSEMDTADCGYCEQTRLDLEVILDRQSQQIRKLRQRMGILERMLLLMMSDTELLTDRVINQIRSEKNAE